MIWLGCGYGNGSNRMGFTALKIAVLAPMPSARVSVATIVKVGCFSSIREPYCRSCHKVSIDLNPHMVRQSSLVMATLPNVRRATILAAAGELPASCISCASISKWARISSSSSCSARWRSSLRMRYFNSCHHLITNLLHYRVVEFARWLRSNVATYWSRRSDAAARPVSDGNIWPGDYSPTSPSRQ